MQPEAQNIGPKKAGFDQKETVIPGDYIQSSIVGGDIGIIPTEEAIG
jgi:hypothetical protein